LRAGHEAWRARDGGGRRGWWRAARDRPRSIGSSRRVSGSRRPARFICSLIRRSRVLGWAGPVRCPDRGRLRAC